MCGWEDDPDLFAATFPMDLRPQGPEIIRTWLFATLLRSHLEHDVVPWRHTTINGWILDPDRKKMSKSKGNVVTPMSMLEEYGSDAVRYWACNGRPGTDTALDDGVMKIGRRLAIKILNASKFALGRLGDGPVPGLDAVHEALDVALLAELAKLIEARHAAHEGFDYARALELTEGFFWSFCDDYVELVKTRAYGEHTAEAPTRPGPPWPSRSPRSSGSSRRSSPSSPRRSGAGGRAARCTRRRGPRSQRSARTPAPIPACSTWPPRCSAPSAARRRAQAVHARPGGHPHGHGATARRCATSRRRGKTSSTPAAWTTS